MMPRRRAHATPPDPNTIIAATQSQWIARFGMNELTTTANVSMRPTTTTAHIAEAGHGRRVTARARRAFRLLLKSSPRRKIIVSKIHTLEMRPVTATIPDIARRVKRSTPGLCASRPERARMNGP